MKFSIYLLFVAVVTLFANFSHAKNKLNDDRILLKSCQALMANMEQESAELCKHYIRGFLAGAIVTDTNNAIEQSENKSKSPSFTDRAYRTRVGKSSTPIQIARFMHFCLPKKESAVSIIKIFSNQKAVPFKTTKMLRNNLYKMLVAEYPCI